jgi:hypothetical protein
MLKLIINSVVFSLLLGLAATSTLSSANILRAAAEGQGNKHGCDKIIGYQIDHCGQIGACCDAHDDCFTLYKCHASSWIPGIGSKECNECNAAMGRCMQGGGLGPSRCCANGNCGVVISVLG